MKLNITPESFRKDKLGQFKNTSDWITKNFETFWQLAKEAQMVDGGAFRIETAFGDWQWIPHPKQLFHDKIK